MTRIRVIDFETTGLDPETSEVIEYGWCDLVRSEAGVWEVGKPAAHLYSVRAIPPEARAVHHITMDDVAEAYPFDEAEVHNPIEDVAVFAAHSLAFEDLFIPSRCLPGICTWKAALRLYPDAPSHSNTVLRYWLEDRGLISLDHETAMPPHRAAPDAYVTAHLLKSMLDAGTTGREMVAWTKEPGVLPRCTIGEFMGKPWPEVTTGFLEWMTRQPTMEPDLKWNARRELDRRNHTK